MKNKPDSYWKEKLSPEQYRVLRKKGTERAFTGKLYKNEEDGSYECAGCGHKLFGSDVKYDSDCGWPSFFDVEKGNVELKEDKSLGTVRTEVVCASCGGHLGHLFEDGPKDKTGLRYCINSESLNFVKK